MRPFSSRGRYDVAGRTVFITGAARGIGAASARRLHAAGANVALVGLEPSLLEELAASLGDRACAFEADVTSYDALQRAVRGTVARFGAIDVAIANAGISFIGQLATAPMEHVERTLEVNLMGVWRTNRAVIEQIVARRGYLLNISSLAAASHAPLMGPYAASKAGVEALTDSLRAETAPTGARVGCAYFGFIDTDLVRASFAHPATQVLKDTLPSFVSTPAPLSQAIDAIEHAIARRSARVWAPRYVGGALALRGVLQPLTELRMRFNRDLPRALELADPGRGGVSDQHSELGVAVDAVRPPDPQPAGRR
ncbi:MAG TPA: short-chain dehydrogenase/reductase [Solirubrobacteraceae bacterium]|jgi:NAD(P)-dependent dehydrogenase (short-subunit alcohol dehydrogenase family)|nr:short-chain dehydrogenase/reductase [Solirubrobacteraceae bacterium]